MRVVVSAWFWSSPTTGSGQYVRRLVARLAADAPEEEIILVAPRGLSYQAVPTALASVLEENLVPGRVAKLWFEQVVFPRACRQLHADVAHVPYWAPPLFPSVPTVVTIHDLIPLLLPEYRGGAGVRAYTALVTRASGRAALVLTDSEASRRDILTHLRLPAERVRAVSLAAGERFGPDHEPADGEIRGRYGLPNRYVLYLGGFDVRKNLAAAFGACRQADPAIGPDCPLVVAGRLPEQDSTFAPDPRRLAREAGLDDRAVRFIGFVEPGDVPALYRGAAALIFPSRYEGFGLPPLEALACGTPVVSSDAGSLPEVVGDGGVLVAPDDVAGMAEALGLLVTDASFRAELSQRARAQAARFSWERAAQENLAAYRDAAGG